VGQRCVYQTQRSGSLRKLCDTSKTVLAAPREAGTDLLVILEQKIG
jgi:hypothetical protein